MVDTRFPQWSRERHDSSNSGRGGSLADNETGALKWCRDLGAAVGTTPSIGVDGIVYVGTEAGTLFALEPEGGAVTWEVSVGQPIHSTPAVDRADQVYFGDDGGFVHGLDANGTALWPAFDTGVAGGNRSPVRTSPLLEVDAVEDVTAALFVGAAGGDVIAIGADDGQLRWRFAAGGPLVGSLAFDVTGAILAPSADGRLYGVTHAGSLMAAPRVAPAASPSAAVLGTVQIAAPENGRGVVLALTPDLLGTRWRSTIERPVQFDLAQQGRSSGLIALDEVLVVDADGRLHVLGETTGAAAGRCEGGDDGGAACKDDDDCPGGRCGVIFDLGVPAGAAPTVGMDGTIVLVAASADGAGAAVYAIERRFCDSGEHGGTPCRSDEDCAGAEDDTSGICTPGDEEVDDPNRDENALVRTRWVFRGDAACGAGSLAPVRVAPSFASDGTVYVASEDGYVYALGGGS